MSPSRDDKLRPVQPGEWPRFGSIWTWSDNLEYVRLMALRRGTSKFENPTVWFLDLMTGHVDREWMWSDAAPSGSTGWYCVDEGPIGAHHV